MDGISSDGRVSEEVLVDLIERAQQSCDPDAFDGLYLIYADRMYRYLLAHLGNADEAADLTSQVFIHLIEKIGLYKIHYQDNTRIFLSWLYTMTYNKMIDIKRAENRQQRAALEYARQVAQSGSMDIIDMLDLEEILQKLRCLNARQRDVIILRFMEGFNIAETAQIMKTTEAAVKALQQRALENLRNYQNPDRHDL